MRNKMSMSDAGRLGAIASKATKQKQKQKRIEEYNKNPKLCLFCKNPLEYKNYNQKKFCNNGCSASYHNQKRHLNALENLPVCPVCKQKTKQKQSKWCSTTCMQQEVWENKKKEIVENNKVSGLRSARRYLLETQGYKCAIPHCGISEWHGQPVLLICDHINGNADDWNLPNLRMICSNCDAQTSFYKGKNKGNGRHNRRLRYKNGLSF